MRRSLRVAAGLLIIVAAASPWAVPAAAAEDCRVRIEPAPARVGEQATLIATGFTPNGTGGLDEADSKIGPLPTLVTFDGNGELRVAFTVPREMVGRRVFDLTDDATLCIAVTIWFVRPAALDSSTEAVKVFEFRPVGFPPGETADVFVDIVVFRGSEPLARVELIDAPGERRARRSLPARECLLFEVLITGFGGEPETPPLFHAKISERLIRNTTNVVFLDWEPGPGPTGKGRVEAGGEPCLGDTATEATARGAPKPPTDVIPGLLLVGALAFAATCYRLFGRELAPTAFVESDGRLGAQLPTRTRLRVVPRSVAAVRGRPSRRRGR